MTPHFFPLPTVRLYRERELGQLTVDRSLASMYVYFRFR